MLHALEAQKDACPFSHSQIERRLYWAQHIWPNVEATVTRSMMSMTPSLLTSASGLYPGLPVLAPNDVATSTKSIMSTLQSRFTSALRCMKAVVEGPLTVHNPAVLPAWTLNT